MILPEPVGDNGEFVMKQKRMIVVDVSGELYTVKKVTNSLEVRPGERLTKQELEVFVNRTNWTVDILPRSTSR
jgi:hypothetical protein